MLFRSQKRLSKLCFNSKKFKTVSKYPISISEAINKSSLATKLQNSTYKSTTRNERTIGSTLQTTENCITDDTSEFCLKENDNEAVPGNISNSKPKKLKKNIRVGIYPCNCGKDPLLPCCSKAREWIKLMYEMHGKPFSYFKYKNQYEVYST